MAKASFANEFQKNVYSAVNYALRILKPIFDGEAESVELKQEAEESYAYEVQATLDKTVFNSGGCQSVCDTPFFSLLSLLHYPAVAAATVANFPHL